MPYLTFVFFLGVLGATVLAVRDFGTSVNLALAGLLSVLALLSVWVPLRFRQRGQDTGFTLETAVLIAMLFTLPSGYVPALLGLSAALAHAARRPGWTKFSFNTGHVLVASSVATVVFRSVGAGGSVLTVRSVSAAVAATVAFDLANSVTLAELFRRLEGKAWIATLRDTGRLFLVTATGNISYGLLLAFVATHDLLATALAGVLMVGLFLGYRGYARLLAERERTERLHGVTRALVDATGSREAMEVFLRQLAQLFQAETAELVLSHQEKPDRFLFSRGSSQPASATPGLVDEAITRGTHFVATSRSEQVLEQGGFRDGMAAPLLYEGRTVGAVAVYDRHGLESWDDTDATLLGTIANEAAVALKNVELFAAVERERALLAEESRKLSDIVENASDGIAMIEADGRIAVWNEAMEAITGLGAAQAFSQPWDVVLRLRDREGEELIGDNGHVFSRALRGERGDEELDLQCLRRDGQWRWLRCSINPIERSGMGVVGAVLVARDVTRDREVDELKGDFIATVSHELRTPLTPLKGFLDTLMANGHRLTEEQRQDVHRAMRGQVERLERLVGDLLLVADVERRELGLHLEAVDLTQVVTASLERLTLSLDPDRVTVDTPGWLGAVGDRAAVTRIVTSLIDNALKHTEGPVRVRVLREGEQAVCEVSDEGPGIAPWDHERVFHRFGRLGNHLHRTQGPGLGLPISRGLAQELGGDVTLESDLGKGVTVRLTLPASAPRMVPETTNGSAPNTA